METESFSLPEVQTGTLPSWNMIGTETTCVKPSYPADADKQNPLEKYLDKDFGGGDIPKSNDNFASYRQKNGYAGPANPLMNTGNYGFEKQGNPTPQFENSRSNGVPVYGNPGPLAGYGNSFNTGYGNPAPQTGIPAPAYGTMSPFQVSRPPQNGPTHTPNKASPLLYNFS